MAILSATHMGDIGKISVMSVGEMELSRSCIQLLHTNLQFEMESLVVFLTN